MNPILEAALDADGDSDAHLDRFPQPDTRSEHGQVANERACADGDSVDEEVAVHEHHVGPDGRAIRQVRSAAEVEDREVSYPCVGIDCEIQRALVAEEPEE